MKNCQLTSYGIIFGQRSLFSFIKLAFREKLEFYLLYYNAIFKDCILFKETQSGIKIDVIVVKKHMPFKFPWKVCKIEVKKNKSSCYFNYHYWIYFNMPECASIKMILNISRVPNMSKFICKFWIWQVSQYVIVTQRYEYARICLDKVRNISFVLNKQGFRM